MNNDSQQTARPSATLLALYTSMLRIRRLEEKIAELLRSKTEIFCPVHLYIGQEAVAVGVCASLRKEDYVFSTHRSHGHYLAKSGDMKALVAELYGRSTGCSGGHGGSMHLAAPSIGLPGSSAIVAGTIPLAVGAALAAALQGRDSVAVAFFGDGATNEGIFYESLNIAALRQLPVVFVCENNLYSTHLPIAECLADTDISRRVSTFGLPASRVDGNDVLKVQEVALAAVDRARNGKGPSFIECMTYRWLGHVGPNDDLDKGLRSKAELEYWMGRCPLKQAEAVLMQQEVLDDVRKNELEVAVQAEVNEAFEYARGSPYPETDDTLRGVFAD